MINPFIANNDSHYLFRKNYQFVAKNEPPTSIANYSASKLNILQSNNPFKTSLTSNNIIPINSTFSPRSLSNSRVVSPQNKLYLGKSRLLD